MKIPHGRKELNQVYGKPYTLLHRRNLDWEADNLITMPLPYPMRLAWDLSTTVEKVTIHKRVAPYLTQALARVWNHARLQVKQKYGFQEATVFYDKECAKLLRRLNLDVLGGTFNPRPIRGTRFTPSTHWYGCAIDIDPLHNRMGAKPTLPEWFIGIFEDEGWTWGGNFKRVDGQHFQLASGV